jgi:hypothetical protein
MACLLEQCLQLGLAVGPPAISCVSRGSGRSAAQLPWHLEAGARLGFGRIIVSEKLIEVPNLLAIPV